MTREAFTPIYGPRPRCKRNRQRDEAVCANLSGFNLGLLPRAIMDIRPLLSSITRRPQVGPWSRTRLQKCRWNRFSIRPFPSRKPRRVIVPFDRDPGSSFPALFLMRCGPIGWRRSHGRLRACSRPCARVSRPGQQPRHWSGAVWPLPPTRLRSHAEANSDAAEVRLWHLE